PVRAIIILEEQRPIHVRERDRGSIIRGAVRVNVRNQHRAVARAIALPQLPPKSTVDGREEQRAVDVRELLGIRAVREVATSTSTVVSPAALGVLSREEVLDLGGASGGAVALPQLCSVIAVVGGEEQCAVHARQVAACDRADRHGATRGSIALPKSAT